MFCVSIMYPNPPGSKFNLQHYLDVHMPLGIGLLHKHFGVAPQRIEVFSKTAGADGSAAGAAYHCICNMHFEKQVDVDRLTALFGTESAARLLIADWPSFTQADPVPLLSRRIDLDPAELIAKAAKVIADAERQLSAGS